MRSEIAIVGVGMTGFTGNAEKRLEEMVFEAARRALDDAGLERKDVDTVCLAASDEIDGRSISSMVTSAPAGAYLKDEIKVTDEGSYALLMAAMQVLSGISEVSLVVSWSKTSEGPLDNVTNMRNDPFYHRGMGLNHLTTIALGAQAYRHRYQLSEDFPARVVVKNRLQGMANPRAAVREKLEVEEVLDSPWVAWPVRKLEVAPLVDGACALVVASSGRAARLTSRPVFILGMGWSADSYYLGERDLTAHTAVREAAGRAYGMAGISGPQEVDFVELHDVSAWHEILAYEALGLCGAGEAEAFFNRLTRGSLGRPLSVNPSGGAICTNPFFCRGLVSLAEAVLQLRGEAGPNQVSGARLGLVQSSNGFWGQAASVFVLGR